MSIAIKGIAGELSDISEIDPSYKNADIFKNTDDIDLKIMAEWAQNYLINTPRKEFDYEPVFQCHPLKCPPIPKKSDVVVACDTDARMDWEWYYMREITDNDCGTLVEEAFHNRIKRYVDKDGVVWAHAGCYNETLTDAEYKESDNVIHIWGATKILKSLCLEYQKTGDTEALNLAIRIKNSLKKLAVWDDNGRCYFAAGMGALYADKTPVSNTWNSQPAPIIEPLVTLYKMTGEQDTLDFAKAYADGVIDKIQPDGLKFNPDGSFDGHSHATMHCMWGMCELSLETDDDKYISFAEKAFLYLLSLGTGTGWVPAATYLDNCNETCCISDMITISTLLGKWGKPHYFDYAERYFRNYISNLQFIVTPEFVKYYKKLHCDKPPAEVNEGLEILKRFQGGIVGGSGLNDYENVLLGGTCGFEMFGCCSPEGMRAIYTMWSNVAVRSSDLRGFSKGVYINFSLNADTGLANIRSAMPDHGGVLIKAKVSDDYYIRIPHWADAHKASVYVNEKKQKPVTSGAYLMVAGINKDDEITVIYPLVSFTQTVSGLWSKTAGRPDLSLTFRWVGNMVISVSPGAEHTPLFGGRARQLPAFL